MEGEPSVIPATDPGKAPGATSPPPAELLSNPHVQQLLRSHAEALGSKEAAILAGQREIEAIKGQLTPLQQRIAELDAAEKRAKEAGMSEIEKLTTHLTEAESKRMEHETALKAERESRAALEASITAERERGRNERDFFSLLAIQAVSPNAYELRGLLDDVAGLKYTGEEERTQKIQAVITNFVEATGRKKAADQGVEQGPQQPAAGGAQKIAVLPTPPGGQPPQGAALIPDTYTEEQMMALARSKDPRDRELYAKIRDQRIAINQAKGVGPLRMKLA